MDCFENRILNDVGDLNSFRGDNKIFTDKKLAHIDQYKASSERLDSNVLKKKTRKTTQYMKIGYTARQSLIELVIFKGISIRQSCNQLGIKFSTGKSIIKRYRNESSMGPYQHQNTISPQNLQIKRISEQQNYLLQHNSERVKNNISTFFTDQRKFQLKERHSGEFQQSFEEIQKRLWLPLEDLFNLFPQVSMHLRIRKFKRPDN